MYSILHIDDDEDTLLLVKRVLTMNGFKVFCAASGIAGVKEAAKRKHDLILLDIKLPDMDGYEVALKLKGDMNSSSTVPVVALTGQGDTRMSLAVGCDGFIKKPVDINTFPSSIMSFLKKGGSVSVSTDNSELLLEQSRKIASKLQIKIEELEKSNKRLKEDEKVKIEFYRNISHELSTPLTPAIGYLNMLLGEELGTLTSLQRKGLESVKRSFSRVSSVIENLLDMTALSTGRMSFFNRPYDFYNLAGDSIGVCNHQFHDKNLNVTTSIPPCELEAFGDPDKLKRAMVQLIENAVKFSGDRGRIHVVTRAVDDDHMEFCVFDSGPGIPEEEVDAIFKTFYQIDGSTTRTHGGTGVGLALARRIIEKFGGRIWAESPPESVNELDVGWAETMVAFRIPKRMPGTS